MQGLTKEIQTYRINLKSIIQFKRIKHIERDGNTNVDRMSDDSWLKLAWIAWNYKPAGQRFRRRPRDAKRILRLADRDLM